MKQFILIFLVFGSYLTMQAQTVTTIDFTDPATPTYGTNAMMNVGGVMMLRPGDSNGDKQVRFTGGNNDVTPIANRVGFFTPSSIISGYYIEDLNMDGQVKFTGGSNDVTTVANSVGFFTPSSILIEQIP